MQQLDQLSEKLDAQQEKLLKGKPISAEALEEWRTHPVTKLLMIDLKLIQLNQAAFVMSSNGDVTALENHARGKINLLDDILDWNPREDEEQ